MSNKCYWFSGTGNSLYAAKSLASALGDMELVAITRELADHPPVISGEVIGFVFPVYAYGPPAIVRRFIEKAEFGEIKYSFIAMTHGGGPANTAISTDKIFKKRGVEVSAFFTIRMPSNYVVGSNPVEGEKALEIFEKGDEELKNAAHYISQRLYNPAIASGIGGKLKSSLITPLFAKGVKTYDRSFFATDLCNGCGVCAGICPMNNISLTADKRPVWEGHCEACLGCINLCPANAIQTGRATMKRRRYRHRNISIKDLTNRL